MTEELVNVDDQTSAPARQGLRGRIGPIALVLMLLAYNGPIASAIGFVPVVIGYGNGLGAPLAYTSCALLLAVFATCFMKMAFKVDHPGGFYAFITAGLGRHAGLGAAMVAVLVYYSVTVSGVTFMSLAMKVLVETTLGGPTVHWAVYAIGTLLVVGALGYFSLDLSAKVLGVLLLAEVAVIAVYDAAVVIQGGAEGLSADFLLPENFLSGSVGLAFLFAAATFGGFEATIVFRDEVRDPNRTVRRATYGFLAVTGVFYALTTWVVVQALGASNAVAATAVDPTGAVYGTIEKFIGAFALDVVTVLVATSVFAAVLSAHNVLTRYVFNLARDGVFPRGLAKVHHVQKSPYKASLVTTAATVFGVVVFIVSGADINLLYAQLAGIFAYGFLLLVTITAFAILVFLNRAEAHPEETSLWHRVIAPVIALAGLLVIMVLATDNIDVLLGTSKAVALWTCAGVYAVAALGLLYAHVLKSRRPSVYATIGRQ